MSKADKRQRQKARRAAAEAAKRRAELRQRRIRAGVILGAALVGIAVLLAVVFLGSGNSGDQKANGPAPSESPPVPVGEGISCATPVPSNPKEYPGMGPMKIAWDSRDYVATMTTNHGVIEIELFAQDAPMAVNNFVSLACDGFYNNTKFHRVTTSPQLSVIQGGDATAGDGTGGPGYSIPDELSRAKQDGYKRGAVAMANSGPNTSGSQFFIVVKDSVLPPNYTLFGKVISGMDVVDKMQSEGDPGASQDGPPGKPLTIESVTIGERPATGAKLPEGAAGSQG